MEYLSKQRYDELAAELNHLIGVVYPEVREQVAETSAQGDRSENAGYREARRRQAKTISRIRFLQKILYNKPEVVRILLRSIKSCKSYCLIGDKSCLSINFPRLCNYVKHIILGSGEKPRVVLMKVLIERVKFHIALIHKIVGICHDRYFIHNLGIMNRGLCKVDKYRNGSF